MRGCASDSAAAMNRVPTRTPSAPAASAAATPGASRSRPPRSRAATRRRVPRRAAAAASGPRRLCVRPTPSLRDHDVAARRLGGARLFGRLHLPAADRAGGVDDSDQRGVRLGEEEVEVGRTLGRELERSRSISGTMKLTPNASSPPRARRAPARARAAAAPGRGTCRARPRAPPPAAARPSPRRCPSARAGSAAHSAAARGHGPPRAGR